MSPGDSYVLSLTQRWHDRIDVALQWMPERRADVATTVRGQMRERIDFDLLTPEQAIEVNVVRKRVYVELLGLPEPPHYPKIGNL